MVAIPIFHTSNFIVSDPTKSDFVGSIPEAMLIKVPADNVLIIEYRKKPTYGPRPLTVEMRKDTEEANKPQKGGKQKKIVGPFEPAATPKKKVKKAARKPRSLSPIQEDSESHTHSDPHEREVVRNETEDTVTTSQPMVSEPIPTQSTTQVSSPISTSIPITNDSFHVPSLPPSLTATFAPTSIPITIAPCPNVSIRVSQQQISVAQSTPSYTDSTATTTITTSSPQVTINVSDTGGRCFLCYCLSWFFSCLALKG